MKKDYDSLEEEKKIIKDLIQEFDDLEEEFDFSGLDDNFAERLGKIKDQLKFLYDVNNIKKKAKKEAEGKKNVESLYMSICHRDVMIYKLEEDKRRLTARLTDTSRGKDSILNIVDDDSFISFSFGFGMSQDNTKEYLYMAIQQRVPELVSLIPLETDQDKVKKMKARCNNKLSLIDLKKYKSKILEKANKKLIEQGLGMETEEERAERKLKEGKDIYNNPIKNYI
jgi:hypothetical protein